MSRPKLNIAQSPFFFFFVFASTLSARRMAKRKENQNDQTQTSDNKWSQLATLTLAAIKKKWRERKKYRDEPYHSV